jgi:hypothetical protein
MKRVKEGEYSLYIYEYGALKCVKVTLRKEREGRGRRVEGMSQMGVMYVYMEMSQQPLLYNYYILIKMFKK